MNIIPGGKMKKIINTFFSPGALFKQLKEKPEWLMPLIIVLLITAFSAVLTVNMTKGVMMSKQEEVLRDKGMTDEQIEQAQQFLQRPITMVFSAIGALFYSIIILLIFSAVINVFIPILGGKGGFKLVFSVVCFSSLVTALGSLIKLILVAVTKSPYVSTSFTLFAPNLAIESFNYKLLSGFDFFSIWQMILISMGISLTNEIKQKNGYILVFLIWIVLIFVGAGLGSIFGHG